jgi:glycosyltransferase involved in cell wall biosynthesis
VTGERLPAVLLVFEPPDGGVAEHVLELARGMRARGWAPTVAGPVDSSIRARLEAEGIEYLEIPHLRRGYGRPGEDLRSLAWLRRLVRDRHWDVVHAHSAKAGVLARAAAARSGVPCVYSPHCFGYVGDVSARRRAFAITAEWLAGRATAAIVCCCEAERSRARQYRLVATRKLRRVYYGVAADDDSVPPSAELEALRGDGVLVGAIAVMRPQKRLDLLVDVAPEILARFPEARIAIVGNGPLDEELRSQARRHGLDAEPRFRILPFAPPSSSYLRALDVFVLPSSWEAMPIGVLEALAHGVPQVATDVEGTGEEIVPETGILIPPKDRAALAGAICELLSSAARRQAASAASRERHRTRFGLERMLDETLALYAEVADVAAALSAGARPPSSTRSLR